MTRMKPEDLSQWRQEMQLSIIEAADQLGVHRVTFHSWLSGKAKIPYSVDLACSAIAFGLGPYPTMGQATSAVPGTSTPGSAKAPPVDSLEPKPPTPGEDEDFVLAAPFSGPAGQPS